MSASEGYRALVIEDNNLMRRTLVRCLEAGGFRVLEASNARQGIEAAGRGPLDAVTLDLELPDSDGLQVLRKLRKDRSFDRVPIVVYTGTWDEEQRRLCLEAGADEYLRKGESELTSLPLRIIELLRRGRPGSDKP